MKVKPLQNYYWSGQHALDNEKVYAAEYATNQPNWEKRGLVFVEGYLLTSEEYEVVGQKQPRRFNHGQSPPRQSEASMISTHGGLLE